MLRIHDLKIAVYLLFFCKDSGICNHVRGKIRASYLMSLLCTVTNENELLNDYTIKDADAGFDDPSVLEDDNSGSAAPASDEVDF